MKNIVTIILMILGSVKLSIGQVPTSACSNVTAPVITNGIHPNPINTLTPAPVLTQQTIGLPNTEYLIIKKGTCARDLNGNCDAINGGGDVIIGTDADGIFNPASMNRYGISLSSGDTFSVVPFAYNLNQLRFLVNSILTDTIIGTTNPCCLLFNLSQSSFGLCDTLAINGISSSNNINNLADFLTFLEALEFTNQLSINRLLYNINFINFNYGSLLSNTGCAQPTNDGNILCFAIDTISKYKYIAGNCLLNYSINTNNSLSCANTGSAAISITTPGTYSYLWSNGANTSTVNNLNQGQYFVSITKNSTCTIVDTILVNETLDYSVSVNVNNCSRTASIQINTNPNSYNYSWSNGSTGSAVNNLPIGVSYVTATNLNNGCSIIASVTLTPSNSVTVTSTPEFACTNNGEATVNIQNPSNFNFVWSNGATGQTAYNLPSGNYIVTISNPSNGCFFSETVSVNATPNFPFSEICLVSVDSLDGKNKIIWEKIPNQGIEFYKIFKQNSTTSQFDSIAIVHVDSFSVFKDNNSNPSQQSASYRISAVDSCGYEVSNFNEHTTIHLSANQGVNNNVNLQWNAYNGFSYPNFEIYRSNNGLAYVQIGTVANSSLSYTDLTPPSGTNYYYVAVTKPSACNPSKAAQILKAVSNILDGQGNPVNSSIPNLNESEYLIFPNPFKSTINIDCRGNDPIQKIEITDVLGRKLSSIDLSDKDIHQFEMPYPSGTYYVSIENVQGQKQIFKVVKQ